MIEKKFEVVVVSDNNDTIAIEETDFYQEMNSNRIGNLLEAARIKAGLTQKQLAEKTGIKQNMINDYEHGKRKLSLAMAERISKILNINQNHLIET